MDTENVTDGLEEGEISDSDDSYTPLARPKLKNNELIKTTHEPMKIVGALEAEDISDFEPISESSTESDSELIAGRQKKVQKKKRKHTHLIAKQIGSQQNNQMNISKKYNIWSDSLQEESLTENMRGFEVNKGLHADRNVESYDYTFKYRCDGGKQNNKRQHRTILEYSDGDPYNQNKRVKYDDQPKRPVKERLSLKKNKDIKPRYIKDLSVDLNNKTDEIASDIADKLREEREDIITRITELVDKDICLEAFREVQKIEKRGGMLIMNGERRRTSGGIFFYLIKNHSDISDLIKEEIFDFEKNKILKKNTQALKRNKKVAELKKQLYQQDKELTPLSKRTDLLTLSHAKPEASSSLANPPPSPNVGLEQSPEYISHAINHVRDPTPEKLVSKAIFSSDNLVTYDDDYLQIDHDDIDMF